MATNSKKLFKVRLGSGRVVGPVGLDRIRLLILRGHINGTESARDGSHTPWKDINRFPEIGDLLVLQAQGKLEKAESPIQKSEPEVDLNAATVLLSTEQLMEPEKTQIAEWGSDEPTLISEPDFVEDLTQFTQTEEAFSIQPVQNKADPAPPQVVIDSSEATQVLSHRKSAEKRNAKKSKPLFILLVVVVLVLVLNQMQEEEQAATRKQVVDTAPVVARFPAFNPKRPDAAQSEKLYLEGLSYYVLDQIPAYKAAVKTFEKSIAMDMQNYKAIAMLASTYTNLIDVSVRDEEYFAVINKLTEMSRSKNIDFIESVIADVELSLALKRPFSAEKRIAEYTEKNTVRDSSVFYYMALTLFQRGNYVESLHYLSLIKKESWFSPKVPYLIAQNLFASGANSKAVEFLLEGLKTWPNHAKSKLFIAKILNDSGKLAETRSYLDSVLSRADSLSSSDRGEAYLLRSRFFFAIKKNLQSAAQDIERAIKINHKNPEYLLEYYTIMRALGDVRATAEAASEVKMFYYLTEGEKKVISGNFTEALTDYMQARDARVESPLPLMSIGDLFIRRDDYSNARLNYEKATLRDPKNAEAWIRFARVLSQLHEWAEAKKAIEKLASLNASASLIDRAFADFYTRQGLIADAQSYYKSAMARDSIDPEVYSGYADNLVLMGKAIEASFYYALALRFDSGHWPSIKGSIRALSKAKNDQEALQRIQDQMKIGQAPKAELEVLRAEIFLDRGELLEAQKALDQAQKLDPSYAEPFMIMGRIYLKMEGRIPDAIKKALESFRSYSERVPSDPVGYVERYKIFFQKNEFKNALTELDRIQTLYPNYFNLNYYYGLVYREMLEANKAVQSFNKEIELHPHNVRAMLALGQAYLQKDPKQALGVFAKAVKLAPQDSEPKEWAGYAHYQLGNPHAALALYQTALAQDKSRISLYRKMGMAYEAVGDTSKAKGFYQRYLDLAPDAPDRAEILKKF